MVQAKSIRSRLLALKPGGSIRFVDAKENTIRNTACVIGSLSGKKFKVTKNENYISVYRYA